MKTLDRTASPATLAGCKRIVAFFAVVLSTWFLPPQWATRGNLAAADAEPSEAAQEFSRTWKSAQEEFAGWQDEKQGPTWKQYRSTSSNEMGDLLMPKTVEAVKQVNGWLNFHKDDLEEAKNDPAVKAIVAEAHKTADQAAAKLNAAFNNVLDEAEKNDADAQDELARTRTDDLRRAADNWFEGTPYHDRNVARARKLNDKWEAMVAGGEEQRAAALAKMTADASAAWPAIAASLQATDGFTPDKLDAFKGKTIRIKGNNALGSTYNPGDYDYVHEINGMPVAGKFTPAVAEAVDKVTKQTGHDLPGQDWDIFAVVEGPGRISHRTHSNGKLKVDGQEVGTVTAEGQQSVPCVVVRIFAVHAGPAAVKSSP
jgi:hypothetical protein